LIKRVLRDLAIDDWFRVVEPDVSDPVPEPAVAGFEVRG